MADEGKQTVNVLGESDPSVERQVELGAAYDANMLLGRPPYWHVEIRTSGEVHWICQVRGWSGGDITFERQRIDLSGADLGRVNLSGMRLRGANLFGTRLREANLCGTVLRAARMDMTTVLIDIALDTETWLGDVVWNGAQLTRVDWTQAPRLGDERAITAAKTRRQRIEALRYAARAYHGLGVALRAQGLAIPASGYRLRAERLERRALRLERKYSRWLFSYLLDIVAGYGEIPGRALACYLIVVAAFTSAYWTMTNNIFTSIHSQTHLLWYEALALSIISFHGRGFFPSMLSLGDPIALVAAAEAIVGLFIELVFIATFTQRFFAR